MRRFKRYELGHVYKLTKTYLLFYMKKMLLLDFFPKQLFDVYLRL